MKKLIVILVSIYSVFTTNLMAQVPNYVPTNGLVGWWPFTGNAIDSSGNGNNGTVNGATLTTDRFGNANKAYSFDGVNDYVQMPSYSMSGSFTISIWYKMPTYNINSLGANDFIFFCNHSGINDNNRNVLVGYRNFGSEFGHSTYVTDNSKNLTGYYSINQIPTPNIWHHLICQFDNGNYIKMYIDDSLFYTNNSVPSNNSLLSQPLFFGIGIPTQFNFFNGQLDDVGIWNRILTLQEITDLHRGCFNNLTIIPTNNNKMIGSNAAFTATVSDTNPSYIWQSNFGQGFQTLNNVGNYSGTNTNAMSVSNVQLSNHMVPIRAISTSGSCKDTSNIAYIKITDTCITKINDTIKITKYDTITTKITKYDTIKVMDTLVINANLSGISAPNNTNRIIVYPNPAKDHITIDYGVFSRMSGYTVKITNTLGQTVFSSPINQQSSFINLSTWTGKGLYYLQIIDPNSNMIENRKIVLQ
jgi:hypothetical protein